MSVSVRGRGSVRGSVRVKKKQSECECGRYRSHTHTHSVFVAPEGIETPPREPESLILSIKLRSQIIVPNARQAHRPSPQHFGTKFELQK